MSDHPHIKNYIEPIINPGGYGGYGGAGLGAGAGGLAGVAGGVIGGMLSRGGFGFGNDGRFNGGEGCVTPTQLTAALDGVTGANAHNALMQGQARIEGLIPAAEGQVQLALAGVQNALSNQINTNLVSNTQGFANVNQNIAGATANIIAVGETIKDTINLTSAQTQLAIANNTAQGLQNTSVIVTAVRDDGDKTRALIVAQNEAGLRSEITALQIKLQEQQAASMARGVEVNVSQNVNQQQAQLQTQVQLVQLGEAIRNLCGDIQAVRTTQSQIVFGNNTGSGQTSNATNNRVN